MSRPRPPEPEKSRAPDRKRKAPHAPVPSHQFLDGEPILDEVRPSVLALALWQRYRDVALWAATSLEHRFGLFGAQGCEPSIPLFTVETAGEPELRPALKVFALLTVHPEATDGETVALMCVKVSEWAFARGWMRTGLLYAELAFAVRPRDPDNARIAGRACRRCALYERGVQWFRVSLALARRDHDTQGTALTLIWWGTLEEQRGGRKVAKRLYLQALKTARRGKLRAVEGRAHHDLLVMSYETASFDEGHAHAVAAFSACKTEDGRMPFLAHDIAMLWVTHGFFSAALDVLLAVLPLMKSPHERPRILSTVARAAAAVGNADQYFRSWREIEERPPSTPMEVAVVFENLARGARTLGYESRARELATKALAAATEQTVTLAINNISRFLAAERQETTDQSHQPPDCVVDLAARIIDRIGAHQRRAGNSQPPDP